MTTTLTRANSEEILIRRVGRIYVAVGLDGTTVNGTNVDLNDPIRDGITESGGTVDSFVLVTDADVATVAVADYNQYLDLAEIRALENALGNDDGTDIKVGPRDEKLSQLGTRIESMIKSKQKKADNKYGASVGTISAGVIVQDFAEHDEDNIDELGS